MYPVSLIPSHLTYRIPTWNFHWFALLLFTRWVYLQPTLVLVVWNSGLIVRILNFILFICLISFTESFQNNIGKYIYVLSIELWTLCDFTDYLSIRWLFIDFIIYCLLIHTAFVFINISLLYLFLDLSIRCGMTLWAMACHETLFTCLLDIILVEIISEPILRLASQALRIYYPFLWPVG